MATRGPKPRPTRLKVLAGNPGRRPLNDREPEPEPKAPPCPRHLDAVARKEWRRVCKLLVKLGVLTELDRAVLIGYCRAWSLYVEADQAVQQYGILLQSKKPGGMPYQSPYLNVMSGALRQMREFAAELGMTPSSRSRVKTVQPKQSDGKARFFKDAG